MVILDDVSSLNEEDVSSILWYLKPILLKRRKQGCVATRENTFISHFDQQFRVDSRSAATFCVRHNGLLLYQNHQRYLLIAISDFPDLIRFEDFQKAVSVGYGLLVYLSQLPLTDSLLW